MTLAEQQSGFIQGLLANDALLPEHWQARERAGYEIYRNAYRARLIDALRETYPRTARLAGEEAFQAAAAHHLITHPPASWTLDDAGLHFDRTLEALFPRDLDVAELGWIEWAMQVAFTAADADTLDRPALTAATAAFGAQAWQDLRLAFVPGLAVRLVEHDCLRLWPLLGGDESIDAARELAPLSEAQGCIVWRGGLCSTFTMVSAPEARALAAMQTGANYADACELLVHLLGEEPALQLAGTMLARWLDQGWITRVSA
ncbi:DNA-binding domain-containing protein [Novosphingobium album (ex Hu et al. 2023)]|uniref:DNA-binding domain-containing protein n=1 Tax=Novosphingobium album (ex Hu et al. 2023) TaxID=2930093 RepID=A0ABT0B2I7_9SPHN|nr:DNA-binding domain-containing protein [Novosphingobium album (ex Hu et al. 2023)]MCJ2179139.1 DNA-binding domain-containing protein [Novosphingobium album (ex Hu et al. 2023)]